MNRSAVLQYAIQEISPDSVRIHLSTQVGDTHSVKGGNLLVPRDLETSRFDEDEVPDFLRESNLLRDIRNTEGVALVEVGSYCLEIHKGALFDWKEIVPQVLVYISMHLNPNGEVEEVKNPDPFKDGFEETSTQTVKEEPKSRFKAWCKKLRRLISKS